jgi:hypothetical protein
MFKHSIINNHKISSATETCCYTIWDVKQDYNNKSYEKNIYNLTLSLTASLILTINNGRWKELTHSMLM